MYNDNYPDDFEERQNGKSGADAVNENAAEEQVRQDGGYSGGQEGAHSSGIGGNGRQDGEYQYHNYYNDRYRGADRNFGQQGGSSCQSGDTQDGYQSGDAQSGYGYQSGDAQSGYGYQSGDAQSGYGYQNGDAQSGYGYQSGGAQGGYGYQSSRSDDGGRRENGLRKKNSRVRIAAAVLLVVIFVGFCGGISWLAVSSLQDQLTSAAEDAVAQPVQEQAEQEQPAAQTSGGGQIASAGTIRESGTVTAVVTDVTDVVERVMPACVSITNSYTEQYQDFWGQSYSRDEVASGSGIIIGENDTELLIVSNNHVVDGADKLYVQFIDGETAEAQVKGVDSAVDLAVIAVKLEDIEEATKTAICIAQMGDSDNLKIGEPAIAIGNALGYGQSVTTGVISALNRTLEVSETGASNALIQTDAAINPGNSGGALLNINGEVVGINSNKIGGSVVEGMGYAIPISTAKPIIEELMTRETRQKVSDEEKGYLGISCINVTSEITENFDMPEGIFVAQVYEDTGADRAGLVRGDIITAVAGTAVKTQEELTKQLGYYKAGETVEITIMQGSPGGFQSKNVQVTLSSYDEVNEGSKRSKAAQEEQSGSGQWRLP